MKAQEAVRDFPASLRECANFAKKGIESICKKIGPRLCGGPAERAAQEYMAGQMKEFADDVKIEDFKVSPLAFMGWVWIDVILATIASVLVFISPFVSEQLGAAFKLAGFCLVFLTIFFAIMEFLFYKRFLDPLFPKKTSCNVVARRAPEGEVKQRIVFSGHSDSAMEWHFTYWGGPPMLLGGIIAGFTGFFVSLTGCGLLAADALIGSFLPDTAVTVLRWVLLCWVPIYIFDFCLCDPWHIVQGANDNLTGCYGAISVLKFLSDNKIRFKNTEVVVVTTGGEESGLRGAKAYCEAHKEEDLAIDTVFIGLETLRDYDHMAIYDRDMTGTVANSPIACAIVKKGSELAGLDLEYESVFFGSSDAAAVSQAGIHATTLASMDPAPARYYHTRLDTWDNLDFRTLEKGIEVAIQTAFVFDEVGLNMPE
ncbi:MAG: Zn-dependent exopeptidase M28 [Clostridium sp.]|jgi:hypothetical protein|nr:Zn-dependent exopeptidase M28 [Clostridium sp.]